MTCISRVYSHFTLGPVFSFIFEMQDDKQSCGIFVHFIETLWENRAFIGYFNEHTKHNCGEPSFFLHFYFLFGFGGLGDSQPKPNTFCSIGLWFRIGGSRYVWLWIKRTVEVDWIYIVMGTFYVWRIYDITSWCLLMLFIAVRGLNRNRWMCKFYLFQGNNF